MQLPSIATPRSTAISVIWVNEIGCRRYHLRRHLNGFEAVMGNIHPTSLLLPDFAREPTMIEIAAIPPCTQSDCAHVTLFNTLSPAWQRRQVRNNGHLEKSANILHL